MTIRDWWRDWRERRSALTELKELGEHQEAVLMDQNQNPLNLAKLCLTSGDLDECARQWDLACVQVPNSALRSADSLDILLALRRYDEAEALARRRLKLMPGDALALMGLGRIAEARGDFVEGLRRWEIVRRRVADDVEGYLGCARCLAALERFDEAQAQLDRAVFYDPHSHGALVARAGFSDSRKDWPRSIALWNQIAEQFRNAPPFVLAAKAMMELGQLDEAEAYLAEPSLIYASDLEMALTRCHVAERRGDFAAASSRWATVRSIDPSFHPGYHEGARCLALIGQHAEADQVMAAAIAHFPDQAWPLRDFARLAHNRRDWNEAATRWAAVRQHFPDDPEGYLLGFEALNAAGRSDEAAAFRRDL